MSGSEIVSATGFGAQPFGLYLELEKGRFADLEVVARATIALAEAMREVAFIIDPSLDIRIELESGTEGSLWLKTWLRTIKPGDFLSKKNLLAISGASFFWFAGEVRDIMFERAVNKMLDEHARPSLTEQDIQDIASQTARIIEQKLGQSHVQAAYLELHRDPTIKAVGAQIDHTSKPVTMIPRSEFLNMAGVSNRKDLIEPKRTSEQRIEVTLVSPVLIAESPRKWRFDSGSGEFGASIRDESFLRDLAEGKIVIVMKPGIRMDVLLETKQIFKDHVWHTAERNVIKVFEVMPPGQGSLPIEASSLP